MRGAPGLWPAILSNARRVRVLPNLLPLHLVDPRRLLPSDVDLHVLLVGQRVVNELLLDVAVLDAAVDDVGRGDRELVV